MPGDEREGQPRRRAYEKVLRRLENRWKRRHVDSGQMMQEIVNALWDHFGGGTYAWCGFYALHGDGRELLPGPCRDTPARAVVTNREACGRALRSRTTQVVPGAAGPKEASGGGASAGSEITVPVLDAAGSAVAVLAVLSATDRAFGEEDRRWLERIVKAMGQSNLPERLP